MKLETNLELIFLTEEGKTARFTVNNPKEDLTDVEIKAAMQEILDSEAFVTKTGPLVAIKEARIVERNVTSFGFEE